jgi:hypothetical protein
VSFLFSATSFIFLWHCITHTNRTTADNGFVNE